MANQQKRKNEDELNKMHWRDRYEHEAQRTKESLSALSEAILLERVKKNSIDIYFQVWRMLSIKGTVKNAAPVMWDYLRDYPGEKNMLNRYHCTEVLFNILGIPDPASKNELRKRVQWDHHGEAARQKALKELKTLIEEKSNS